MNDQDSNVEEVKSEVVQSEDRAGVMAIVSLVLGIVSILCCIPFLNILLSIAAIVLGAIELKNIKSGASSDKGKVMAIIGIVLGSLNMIFVTVIMLVLGISYFSDMLGMYQGWY